MQARERAAVVRAWLRSLGISRVVLLGRRVAAAFGLDGPWQRIEDYDRERARLVVTAAIPHPSGRCREYNDEAARVAAGEIVRWAAGLPARINRRVPTVPLTDPLTIR